MKKLKKGIRTDEDSKIDPAYYYTLEYFSVAVIPIDNFTNCCY